MRTVKAPDGLILIQGPGRLRIHLSADNGITPLCGVWAKFGPWGIIESPSSGWGCIECVKVSHQKGLNSDYRRKISRALQGNLNGRANRRIPLNENVFSVIATEEAAYWLGFLVADGYVHGTSGFGLKLAARDEVHIEKFRAFIQSKHPIKQVKQGSHTYSKLQFGSIKFVRELSQYGIVPHKSPLTFFPPENLLPKDLIRHFIRGVFDGDGWITFNERIGLAFGIIGTRNLLTSIQSELVTSCSLNFTKLCVDKRHKSSDYVTLGYGGNNQVRRIYHYLYDDSQIFLQRKEEVWHKICL